MATVLLESVNKRFPDGTQAVSDVSIEIEDQEFLVLVGPSGCGKSTTLRIIAGLEGSTGGVVRIGGRDVTNVAPKDRDIAMVFQNYALYPHMSVYKNLSFGLTLRLNRLFGGGVIGRGLRKIFQPQRASEFVRQREEIGNKVRRTALRLGIEHLLDRKPHQLSGGERQRVALGRAIVRNPAAFLFDEPLSNLDAKLRQQLRVELKRLHRDLKATMIYVTHDQVEAMTLGDRVAIMNEGRILQVGGPLEVYQRPANLFVAKFIGNSPINLCPGTVSKVGDRIEFESRIPMNWGPGCPRFDELDSLLAGSSKARAVVVGFRAEDVGLAESEGAIEVEVTEVDRLGESTMVHSRVCGPPTQKSKEDKLVQKNTIQQIVLFRLESDAECASGDRLRVKIDLERVLWFDPDSGENLLKE
ncbi:MAG: ATP-binding cassette domain-containing protein [Planctomycetaceae bacterium]|nr:ATP-binding cassette domain-containing protein [Planctomycetaceae bacterium]